jgi:hypothetical protein
MIVVVFQDQFFILVSEKIPKMWLLQYKDERKFFWGLKFHCV